MSKLIEKFAAQVPGLRQKAEDIKSKYGAEKVSEVLVSQIYGGMRGIQGMICDTSYVSSSRGLIVRGRPVLDLSDRSPEEIFWLLLTGDIPSEAEAHDLGRDLASRSDVPDYVFDVLRALPDDSHPMAMLNTCILALERESVFRSRYFEGMKKQDYWEATLEDGLNLIAKLPTIAAAVYRLRYQKGNPLASKPEIGWGANFAQLLGMETDQDEFAKFINLYLNLHADHEGGNVSAFSCATVSSALSDPYYSVAAGLSGLAGPLHGLANQECLRFVLNIRDRYEGAPTDDQLVEYAWEVLKSGKVIPGYGHAVLRCTDPRFTGFHNFSEEHIKDEPLLAIVDKIYRLIPDVLREHGKAKSPFPNVDAITGSMLYHYGLKEYRYYTVLFAVSRSLGLISQIVLSRATGMPIIRPKSVTTEWVMNKFETPVKV